jgi:diacylglycerol kinase (ATP)
MHLLRRHHISFKNALNGIIWALKTQANFRVHLALSAIVIIGGFLLHAASWEMTVLVLTIVLGLTCEMINTSIEAMTDLITMEYRESAKIAKDVAAGMVLVMASGATGIALIIFLPKLVGIFFR